MMFTRLLLLTALGLASPVLKVRDSSSKPDNVKEKFAVVPLKQEQDLFAIPLQIGATNETIFLKLDTTSSNLWVNSDVNEFCLAYYPFQSLDNNTDWNEFNDGLRKDYLDEVVSFQNEQDSSAASLLKASKTFDFSSAASIISERQELFTSFVGAQKASLTSDAKHFVSTKSEEWASFTSAFESKASKVGNAVITKAESFGAVVTSFGGSLATVITSVAVQDIEAVTSDAEQFATEVTSAFGEITSDVVSDFEDLTQFFKRDVGDMTITITASTLTTFPSVTTTQSFNPSATVLETIFPSQTSPIFEDELYQEIGDCSIFGTFNSSASDSFILNETVVFVSDDEYDAVGFLGKDSFTLPGLFIENVTFAVAEISESNIGVFGLGQSTKNSTFESFPDILVKEDLIDKALYSLQLFGDNPVAIFGAVNFAAFDGNLTLVPLLNDTEAIAITLSSFGLGYANDSIIVDTILAEGQAFTILDSSVENVFLPVEVLDAFVAALNTSYPVVYDDVFGRYIVSITEDDIASEDLLVSFNFQGVIIDVPIDAFLVPIVSDEIAYFNLTTPFVDAKNESFYFELDDDDETAANATEFVLSILPSYEDQVTLGLSFLEYAYVVVDFEDQVVGLATATENSTDSAFDEDFFIIPISDKIPFAQNATNFNDFFGSSNITSLLV